MMKHFSTGKNIQDDIVYKEVVIVGNGPSGILLSYILAGNWPYYNGKSHPDELLTARLRQQKQSLLEQDLSFLSQSLEGRSNSPVSLLMDMLLHPGADMGLDLPSLLDWKYHPEHNLDHVVLGKGPPGGAWQTMDSNVLTVSLGKWMELPGIDFREWDIENNGTTNSILRGGRASVRSVAHYYNDYVKSMKLDQYFRSGVLVTSVKPNDCICIQCTANEDSKSHAQWLVKGYNMVTCEPFTYACKNVVLSVGCTDIPNTLGIPGETENLSWVFHSLSSLEKALKKLAEKMKDKVADCDPIMVVGAGLSAADAIIATRFHSLPVIHVFRKKPKELFGWHLPQTMYPEYHKVHQMMNDNKCTYPYYTAYAEHKVCHIHTDRTVELEGPDGKRSTHRVFAVAILIGSRPNLEFLPPDLSLSVDPTIPADCKSNIIRVDPFSYHATQGPPNIYAMGPIAGDNFVRFLQGGSLAVANDIFKRKEK